MAVRSVLRQSLGWLVMVRLLAVAGGGSGSGTNSPATAESEAGDPESAATDAQLEWFVDEYGSTLFKVAVAVTRSDALAEEVVQDALLQACTSMPSWEADVPIRWMRRVTRNRALSVMRRENRTTNDEGWALRVSDEPGTERLVEGRQAVSALREALGALDEESRVLLVLRETEGTSYEELADLLDLTPSAVKAKLYRARNALKDRLREWEL